MARFFSTLLLISSVHSLKEYGTANAHGQEKNVNSMHSHKQKEGSEVNSLHSHTPNEYTDVNSMLGHKQDENNDLNSMYGREREEYHDHNTMHGQKQEGGSDVNSLHGYGHKPNEYTDVNSMTDHKGNKVYSMHGHNKKECHEHHDHSHYETYGHKRENGNGSMYVSKQVEGSDVHSIHNHKMGEGNEVSSMFGHENTKGSDINSIHGQQEIGSDVNSIRGHKQENGSSFNSIHGHTQEEGNDLNATHDHEHGENHNVNSIHANKQEENKFGLSPYELLLDQVEDTEDEDYSQESDEKKKDEDVSSKHDDTEEEEEDEEKKMKKRRNKNNGDSSFGRKKDKKAHFSWKDKSTEDEKILEHWNNTNTIEDEVRDKMEDNLLKEFLEGGMTDSEPFMKAKGDPIMEGYTFVVDGYDKKLENEDDIWKLVIAIGRELGIMNPLEGVKNAERIFLDLPTLEPAPVVIQFYSKEIRDIWRRQFEKILRKGILDPNAFNPHTATPFYPEHLYPKTTPWYFPNETTTQYPHNNTIEINSTHIRIPPFHYNETPLHYYVSTKRPLKSRKKILTTSTTTSKSVVKRRRRVRRKKVKVGEKEKRKTKKRRTSNVSKRIPKNAKNRFEKVS